MIQLLFLLTLIRLRIEPVNTLPLGNEGTEEMRKSLPIYKSPGSFYVVVYVGSPPQRQTLILDTGSHFMAFPCEPCLSCGKKFSEKYFDPDLSRSNAKLSCGNYPKECFWKDVSICTDENLCQLTVRYTEGSSWTAHEYKDNVWIGSIDYETSVREYSRFSVPIVFGCVLYERGLFRTQYADGILGLAMHPTSISSMLKKEGSIKHNSFSVCLGYNSGSFLLGGFNDRFHLESMEYTDLVSNVNGWYVVQIHSLFVGTKQVNENFLMRGIQMPSFNTKEKGTIIDSGTTDIYLPKTIAPIFTTIWQYYSGISYSNSRVEFTFKQFSKIPNISLVLKGGYHWVIHPKYYMEPVNNDLLSNTDLESRQYQPWKGKKEFTNRVYVDEPNGAILGLNAMLGHDIYFDVQNMRIGIAKADCTL